MAKNFIGIKELTSLIERQQPISGDELFQAWEKQMRETCSVQWNPNHARMQFKHRLEFLRALGMVNKVADVYYLSKAGIREATQRRVREMPNAKAVEEVSHNDIENKLKTIGEFFEFNVVFQAK